MVVIGLDLNCSILVMSFIHSLYLCANRTLLFRAHDVSKLMQN